MCQSEVFWLAWGHTDLGSKRRHYTTVVDRGVVRGGTLTGQKCDEERVAAVVLDRVRIEMLGRSQGRRGAYTAAAGKHLHTSPGKSLTDMFANSPGVKFLTANVLSLHMVSREDPDTLGDMEGCLNFKAVSKFGGTFY